MPDPTAPVTTSAPPAAAPEEPGPRSFGVFFNGLASGQAEGEAAYELAELLKRLHEESKTQVRQVTGSLTIELGFACAETGVVEVRFAVKRKDPKRKTEPSHFWMDKKSRLVTENPRQQKLPLRDVSGARGRVREADDDDGDRAPREV
jgi:hypothetical protein